MHEWHHKASLFRAYIRRNYHARLVRSSLARSLDRTESAVISYALGQAATGIFCLSRLSVNFLMHVDRYAATHKLVFRTARRRADLFGLAPKGWVVAEAKGRSGAMGYDLQKKLIDQKRSVVSIGGDEPWVALGCVAHFPVRGRGMRVDAFDPEESEEEPIAFDSVSRDGLALAYYLPFLRAIELGQRDTIDAEGYVSATFPDIGVRVSLPNSLVRLVAEYENSSNIDGLYMRINEVLTDGEELMDRPAGRYRSFPDGSVIETDWQESLSIQDWEPSEDWF